MKRNSLAKSQTPESGTVRAYLLIQTVPGRIEGIKRALAPMPPVYSVDSVLGPYDIVAVLEVSDMREISHLVAGTIGGLRGVARTTTLICA